MRRFLREFWCGWVGPGHCWHHGPHEETPRQRRMMGGSLRAKGSRWKALCCRCGKVQKFSWGI